MQSIGPYRLDSELGHGAMGVVFRGFDPAIGRAVAIKIIRLDQFATANEKAELKLRFAREATAAGKLSHPNIVAVFHLGEQGDTQYLVLELVEGSSLEKTLAEGQPRDRKMSISMLSQVAGALDYAHGEGIVHRDVKPANILVSPDGKAKITDFGIARISSQTVTKTGFSMGTPAYMAPEQIMSARVNGQADQFSLAVIAYQMLAGRRPFIADTDPGLIFKIVSEEAQALHEIDGSFPPRTSDVLRRGLAKDPNHRYATCADFIADLSESLSGRMAAAPTAVSSPVPEARNAAPASAGRTGGGLPGWAIALGAVALVTVILLLVLGAFNRPARRPVEVADPNAAGPPSVGHAADRHSDAPAAIPPPRTVEVTASPAAARPAVDQVGRKGKRRSDVPDGTQPTHRAEATTRAAATPPPVSHADVKPPDAPAAVPPPPPADAAVPPVAAPALPRPSIIPVGGRVQNAKLISGSQPVYPQIAKSARISGTVELSAIIGEDGKIQELTVVSGHPLLRQAAIDAVQQWIYQPTLFNEQPVKVRTTIDIIFTLSQ
jgi:TonB family protein